MHVIHLAAQPTARRWAAEHAESADASVAAAVGADTVNTARAIPAGREARGLEAGEEAEGDQEADGEEGCEEEGARASQGRQA